MTESLNNLILFLIEENFSSEVAQIAGCLIENYECSLSEIIKFTKKDFQLIRDSLIVLKQNLLLKVSISKKKEYNETVYSLDIQQCLNIIRQPKILYLINEKFGNISKNIVEIFMLNGILSCSQTIECVENTFENNSKITNQIRKEFLNLISNNILVQVDMIAENIESNQDKLFLDKDKYKDAEAFKEKVVINKNSELLKGKMEKSGGKKNSGKKKKLIIDDEDKLETLEKEVKVEENHVLLVSKYKDDFKEIFYKLNYEKLKTELKCQLIFEIVSKRHSIQAAQVCQMFLNASRFHQTKFTTSTAITIKELINLNQNTSIPTTLLQQGTVEDIIKQSKDDCNIFRSYGISETGKELYLLDFENLFKAMKSKLRERIVEQTLSPLHSRVYRLISKCGPLDLKNIGEICMIPNKECCICLNQLVSYSFIEIQELNIKGSNQIFFKQVSEIKDSTLTNIIYKIILNLKNLVKKKIENYNRFDSLSLKEDGPKHENENFQVAKILSVISELDKYLLILEK